MTIHHVQLEDRGVLSVAGEDAASFLQGLLTNDVEGLAVGAARYAALLSPQGKILFDFLVLRTPADADAAFLIDCLAAQAGELAKRLGFYRLRAKVTVSDESARYAVFALWGEEIFGADDPAVTARIGAGAMPEAGPGNETFVFADPRDPRLGVRAIVARARAADFAGADIGDYEAHRIGIGVPRGGVDFAYADIFPHDANLDLLHGVDFEKGCYVGQEVVSRMRHRGGARKRIVRLTLAGAAPGQGTPILAGDAPLGALGSAAGGRALAMVRLDRVEDAQAAGRPLTVGGVGIEIQTP